MAGAIGATTMRLHGINIPDYNDPSKFGCA
jgi:hypothetical protein